MLGSGLCLHPSSLHVNTTRDTLRSASPPRPAKAIIISSRCRGECSVSHDRFLLVIRTFCPLVFRTYFCVDIYKVCVRQSRGAE